MSKAAVATIGVKVIVMNQQDQVLLLRKANSDQWDIPGGGMWTTEQPHIAAAREVKEETGLILANHLIRSAFTRVHPERGLSLYLIFVSFLDQAPVALSPEHQDYTWVHPTQIETYNLAPEYKTAIQEMVS